MAIYGKIASSFLHKHRDPQHCTLESGLASSRPTASMWLPLMGILREWTICNINSFFLPEVEF